MIVVHVSIRQDLLRVGPRSDLRTSADAAVAIGHAPDGLPLVLAIRRSRDVRRPVLHALGVSSIADLEPSVESALARLEQVVSKQTCSEGVGTLAGQEGYTSTLPIGRMLGASLLAKALGDIGPLGTFFDGSDERAAMTNAGVMMNRAEITQMLGSAGATRRLFVPIPDGRSSIVENGVQEKMRPLIFESLRSLRGVRISYRVLNGQWQDTRIDEGRRYREALSSANAVAWWVPRHSLALVLADVGRRLGEMHARNFVHGDLKPANILIGAEGPIPIDPLLIPSGNIATVCTPSWAAPEQVTVRPIGPASDVYALGLMLAKLVEAVVYGEERTFVVPTGGDNKRTMKVLANPDVFIDPTAGMKLDEPSRLAYQRFIARCCAFDPSQRPESGVRFADELSELVARHPLPQNDAGWLDLGWLAGTLERRVDLLGDLQPAWVLTDGSPFRY